jgi:peroxisomal 3,2-trans-enoyl-CoA isomerase
MGSAENAIDAEVIAGSALSAVLRSYPNDSSCSRCRYLSISSTRIKRLSLKPPFAAIGVVPEGGSSYNFSKSMRKARGNALLLAGNGEAADYGCS